MQIAYKKKRIKKDTTPRITGIIVCVDFSDYLQETLPFSKLVLDDLYVVTAKDDKKTRKLCKKTQTKCLSIPRTTPTFLKGVYINHAFDNIPQDDWFLVFDADIILPQKKVFDVSMVTNKDILYGVFCTYCNDYEQWIDHRDNGTEYYWKTRARYFHVGMGAFQLFHTHNFRRHNFRYPPYTGTITGGRRGRRYSYKGSDYFFSLLFRNNIMKLPFNVIHLDNRNYKQRATTKNYQNRETNIFE